MSAVADPAKTTASAGRRLLDAVLLLPRNVAIGILDIYRAVISPLYGDVCRYYPSCSRYALESIQQHGVVKGVWLGSKRLARCHPWAAGGVDDVPPCSHGRPVVIRFGFVRAIDPIPHDHQHHTHREG